MGNVKNILPDNGIIIKLDKPRTIRFTMRSLAWLADKYGSVAGAIQAFNTSQNTNEIESLYAIADIVCAGIINDDPTITHQFVYDNIQIEDIIKSVPDIIKAFKRAMPQSKATVKNNDDDNQAISSEDWPWEYYYTISRAGLHLTDSEFWNMAPCMFFMLVSEYLDLIDYKATIQAMASNGTELPKRGQEEIEEVYYVHPDAF